MNRKPAPADQITVKVVKKSIIHPREINPDKHRICRRCGLLRPIKWFSRSGTNKDGTQRYRTDCKTCVSTWREGRNLRLDEILDATPIEELPGLLDFCTNRLLARQGEGEQPGGQMSLPYGGEECGDE